MNKASKLALILFVFSSVIVGFAFYAYATAGCSIDRDFQQYKVEQYLIEKGLPIEHLVYDDKQTTECRTSFTYKSETEDIHFMVIDGGKVTWWDSNKPGN